ncbi:protein of unknown function [Xenorhabdus nematophila AN6/1]|nr:protein of unknown function [Xenorhabdus nematophila AN6/1]
MKPHFFTGKTDMIFLFKTVDFKIFYILSLVLLGTKIYTE